MKSKMIMVLFYFFICITVLNLSIRHNKLDKKILEGLDIDVIDPEKNFNKKEKSLEIEQDLFVNIFDFEDIDKFNVGKEYSTIVFKKISELNKSRGQGGNVVDLYLLPQEVIEDNQNIIRNEKISRLIRKETNTQDTIEIEKETEFYANFNSTRVIHHLLGNKNRNFPIYRNLSEASQFVILNPTEIYLQDKPICIPLVTLIKVKNPQNENLILNSIITDLHQITIFHLDPSKQSQNNFQKNIYPKIILPGETINFQIIILPDHVGRIHGNIIFNFSKKRMIIYPVDIFTKENLYGVTPVYFSDWHGSKLLNVPIEIYNPHEKTLIIKEITNSFSSINTEWINGQLVSQKKTKVTDHLLEIPPKEKLTLLHLNFYKEFDGIDYGLLQVKTDRDILIIPVLISVEIPGLDFFPKYLDFGLVDLNSKVNRVIPVSIINYNSQPIQLKAIYSTYDHFVEFIPNLDLTCCFEFRKIEGLGDKTETNICIIEPEEHIDRLGYFLLNVEKLKKMNNYVEDTCHYGSLMIHNSFAKNPFLELEYSYCLTQNLFKYSLQGKEVKLDKNNFAVIDYNILEREFLKFQVETRFQNKESVFRPNILDPYYDEEIEYNLIPNEIFNLSRKNWSKLDYKPSIEPFFSIIEEKSDSIFVDIGKLYIAIVNPRNMKRYYNIPFKTSVDGKFGVIPIKFNTNSLDFLFCDKTHQFSECKNQKFFEKEYHLQDINLKETYYLVNFGLCSTNYHKIKYFTILNESENVIKIENIEISNRNVFIEVEYIGEIYQEVNESTDPSASNINLGRIIVSWPGRIEKIKYSIPPGKHIWFSATFSSKSDGLFHEYVKIFFANDVKLNLKLTAEFHTGQFNISTNTLKFNPGFPGLVQERTITANSFFKFPIIIESVNSSDKRIVPEVKKENSVILTKEKKDFLKVYFNPSKQTNEKYFVTDPSIIDYTNDAITYKEYFIWKENQKIWETLNSDKEKTVLDFGLSLKSTVMDSSSIFKVKASIVKPRLSFNDEINFEIVNLGETANKYIEISNPSSETISVQLFLASEEFSDIHTDNDQIFYHSNESLNLNPGKGTDLYFVMDCYFLNDTNQKFYNFLNITNTTNSAFKTNNNNNNNNNKKSKDLYFNSSSKNSIIFQLDYMDSEKLKLTKDEIIKKMNSNSCPEYKQFFNLAKRFLCNHRIMKKIEILNTEKNLGDLIFSSDFNRYIESIKNMTSQHLSIKKPKIQDKETESLIYKYLQPIKSLFNQKTESYDKSKTNLNNQEFFLPKSVSSTVFTIKPNKKMKIGPILFNPKFIHNSTATLFLKNNLTVLYPIKLTGMGGSGILSLSEYREETSSLYRIKDNILNFEYDQQNEFAQSSVKIVKLMNSGNMPLKIEKILVGDFPCENSWIKIDYCESITLQPREKFDLKVTVKPDFSSYSLEQELIFLSEQKVFNLIIKIEINRELVHLKNSLFTFRESSSSGVATTIIIAVMSALIGKIFYILLQEFKHATSSSPKNQMGTLIDISYKDIIEKNPILKFENMFIKSYRKSDRKIYDDFKSKESEILQSDQLYKKNTEKELNKVEKEEETDITNMKSSVAVSKEIRNKIEIGKNVGSLKSENAKDILKENIQSKNIVIKKSNKTSNKKPTSHNLIGLAGKSNAEKEIKEELEIVNKNKKIISNKDYNIYVNKSDLNAIQANHSLPQNNLYNANRDDHTYTNYERKRSSNNYYEADYWPKNASRPNNIKEIKENSIISKEKEKDKEKEKKKEKEFIQMPKKNEFVKKGSNKIKSKKNFIDTIENKTEIINKKEEPKIESNHIKDFQVVQSENKIEEQKIPALDTDNKIQEVEALNNTIVADEKEKSFENIIPEENKHINIGQIDNIEPLLINPTLNQQFLSFDPFFLVNKDEDRESSVRNKSRSDTDKSDEIIIKNTNTNLTRLEKIETFPEKQKEESKIYKNDELKNEEHFSANNFNQLINNFENFELIHSLDKKEEPIVQDIEENSSGCEEINIHPRLNLEEDIYSQNYQSEREKLDSGTEEFKFNFNSIFSQNNVKLMDHINYKEDTTDNEEMQNGTKPYFDKSLLFPSFDLGKSQSGLFVSSNPFASNSIPKLLDELREENSEDDDDEEENNYYSKKEKDELMYDEDEDEEDPEWAMETVDVKQVGYFDETGTYKLKTRLK